MSLPEGFTVRPFDDAADRESLITLWRTCGLVVPWNDPATDIALFQRHAANAIILVGVFGDGRPVASVCTGHDGHRGWLYYVAVDPDWRGRGLARAAIGVAEAWLTARGIPKAMLMVRETNTAVVSFYERIGYEQAPRVLMQRWLKEPPGDGT
jgi:ribosomal protein S18 acetylase RimI-like enzyme